MRSLPWSGCARTYRGSCLPYSIAWWTRTPGGATPRRRSRRPTLQPFCRSVEPAALRALLEPAPHQETPTPLETRDLFQKKTELGPAPIPAAVRPPAPNPAIPSDETLLAHASTVPTPPRRRGVGLAVAALLILFLIGASSVGAWMLWNAFMDQGGADSKTRTENGGTDPKSRPENGGAPSGANAGDGKPVLGDGPDEPMSMPGHDAPLCGSLKFTPDGLHAVSECGDFLYIWDLKKRVKQDRWQREGYGQPLLALSPDGGLIASVGAYGGGQRILQLFDYATQKPRAKLPFSSGSLTLAFSPDNSLLAVSDPVGPKGCRVRIFDVASGLRDEPYEIQSGAPAFSLAFTRDGKFLLTGSGSLGGGRRHERARCGTSRMAVR